MADVKIKTVVDAAAFTSFYDVFSQYRQAFDGQPEAWREVGKATGESRVNFEAAAKSMRDLADDMDRALGTTRNLDKTSRETAGHWAKIAGASRTAAGHIKEATSSLLRWAEIGGLVSGLAGFGAVYGIDRLAGAVGRDRSFAMGTGTSYAGLQSFRTSFGRFGDAEGLLSRVNEAQSDVSKRGAFAAVGMGDAETRGDSADVATAYLRHLKTVLDRTPNETLGNELRNRSAMISLEQARQLKATSWDEFDRADKDRRGNRASMNLTPEQQRAWQDLATQLSTAGAKIETIFVKNLANLEPGLAHLSDAVVKTVESLLKEDGPVAHWLAEANHGLEYLATTMGRREFRDGVRDFVDEVAHVATGVAKVVAPVLRFAHWLATLTGDSFEKVDAAELQPLAEGGYAGGGGSKYAGPSNTATTGGSGRGGGRRVFSGQKGGWWTDDRIRHAYDVLTKGGLSPLEAEGQIARMAYVEAGAGPTAGNNIGGGHYGIYQADRARQRHFGGSSDFDAQLKAIVTEKNSSEMRSHRIGLAAKTNYEGARSASAFERGEGSRSDGTDNFTAKTEAAMPKIHAIVAPKVRISRNTGGNPTVPVTAAGTPP